MCQAARTEGEHAYRAQPYTFVLRPDLTIHKIYIKYITVGFLLDDQHLRNSGLIYAL
jgi:hypothetical protein